MVTWLGIEPLGNGSGRIHLQLSSMPAPSEQVTGKTLIVAFPGFRIDPKNHWSQIDLASVGILAERLSFRYTANDLELALDLRYPGTARTGAVQIRRATDGFVYATIEMAADRLIPAPPIQVAAAPPAPTGAGAVAGGTSGEATEIVAQASRPRKATRRYTFDTAHALAPGEKLIGLGYLQVGLHEHLELGTVFLADLIGLLNVTAKVKLVDTGKVRLAVQAGFVYLDSEYSVLTFLLPEGEQFSYMAVPITPLASFELAPRNYLHVSGTYAFEFARSSDAMNVDASSDLVTPGGRVMYEHERRGGGRIIIGGGAKYLDDEIRPEAFASYVFSWTKFHLELGAGIGPIREEDETGTTTVSTGLVPRGNLWWRF